ncbi:MAG: N-acetylmuramoyl-L-alanine amidase family 2 protein [Candidatus Peregrinibacteria bacterium GW2011_GWE2_39_6]|nr:MAG: N-acetylmuramoyl-L-alanine amidase family 2 protein [Candidatus Peregrinibacteria bacterium GW2011_GWF2_39_17]KKR25508.1 MAG: N-acetylmuramoyl-L-alanine amidase family 2 protein [Candidatus Peregrinibacteria bacterium GW2011_GWE2_39_6]HCW31930.1 hypothetical protein [Candidatus Peregrinibacteria bacterium]
MFLKNYSKKVFQIKNISTILIGTILISVCFLLSSFSINQDAVSEFNSGGIKASTITTGDSVHLKLSLAASSSPVATNYEKNTTFISQIYPSNFPFVAVKLSWEEANKKGSNIAIAVRFKEEKGNWSPWQDVQEDNDLIGDKIIETYSEGFLSKQSLILTAPSIAIQYRVILSTVDGTTTPFVRSMTFHYIDAASSSDQDSALSLEREIITEPLAKIQEPQARLTFGTGSINIIPRAQWGADESWRLSSYFGEGEDDSIVSEEPTGNIADDAGVKNGENLSFQELYPQEFELTKTITKDVQNQKLYWPLEYAKNIQKIVIHHTASTPNLADPAASVRAIYYYHAITRGWGDIGYNYLIDPEGNIYEGRYGGDGVVGGHSRGYNTGSIGIALIGNYQDSEVPYAVLDSLTKLIVAKADLFKINIAGFSSFRGEVIPNLVGHRDVGSTACPGKKVYDLLGVLKKIAATNAELIISSGLGSEDLNFEPFAFSNVNDYVAINLKPEASTTIELKLKNTGQEAWNNQTYLIVNQNPAAESLIHLEKTGVNAKGVAMMKESMVKPGEIATFQIKAQAYLVGGFQALELTPIFNGTKKTAHYLTLPLYISTPTLSYQLVKFGAPGARVKAGTTFTVVVQIKNTGNVNWYRENMYSLKMGTASPRDRTSGFLANGGNRYGSLKDEVVVPGAIGTFELSLMAPKRPGYYVEYMQPVIDNAGWLEGGLIQFAMSVYDDQTQALFMQRSDAKIFSPGEVQAGWVELKNIGNQTWKQTGGSNKVVVGVIKHPSIGVELPTLGQFEVKPGKTARLNFKVTAPKTPGNYAILLRPRLATGQNLMPKPIYFTFSVQGNIQNQPANLDQELIRLKLSYDESQNSHPQISANNDFNIVLNGTVFQAIKSGEKVEISNLESRYQLKQGGNVWIVDDYPRFVPKTSETIMEIVNYDHSPAWNQNLNDNLYRGTLEVRLENNNLIIINELPMVDYLAGLAEVANSDPQEKVKTIAVLARTYARYYLSGQEVKFSGKPYDGTDNPDEFQKYLGYGYELRSPNMRKAVIDTKGEIVTYQGKLIKTPYFSASPGYTLSAKEVWGWENTPYLIGVKDSCSASTFSGHGVGLSGCGATILANQGQTYRQIIKYYYTGVEVEVK